MTTRRRSARARLRRTLGLAVVLLAVLGTTACVGLPEDGPVVPATDEVRAPPEAGVERRAQPPQEGDSSQAIVTGFIQAMNAFPVTNDVTRQFLTSEEQDAWDPSRRIITYDKIGSATGADTDTVQVRLNDGSWVDSRGTWRGRLPARQRTLRFEMAKENGEWRIAAAPDALLVPDDWFQDHYTPASVYYLDPTASIMVPEPVFVPSEQMTTALVQSLLDGPGPLLADVSRSFVPVGLDPGLSIPIDATGLASISLGGDPQQLSPETATLLVYQFAWTLRQDPRIATFEITIGDQPVTLDGGGTEFSVEEGSEYDPNDVNSSALLFAVRNGRLESGDSDGTTPVAGAFGTQTLGIGEVGVSLKADLVAAVSDGGRALLLGPVNDDPSRSVDTVVSGATDLLRPAWDFAGRLWLVDRGPGGARVSVIDTTRDAGPVAVAVRGISDRQVKDFIVSRDGTRLVAVLAGGRADRIVVSRIRHDTLGRVTGATRALPLAWSSEDTQRILDIGWRSPTSVAVLHRLTKQVVQVVQVPVDGSVTREGGNAQQDPADQLVASPVANETLYTITRDGLLDATGAEGPAKPLLAVTTSVQYVG